MNERLEALIKQCTVNEVDYLAPWFDKELFAQLIIDECTAKPKVYLLFNKHVGEYPDEPEVLHGWTSDLRVAQKWQEGSNRFEQHTMQNLYYVKKIT